MKAKLLLLFLVLLLATGVFGLTQTGEYQGSFDVDSGSAGVVITSPNQTGSCTENWACSFYTACENNQQVFVCSDCNRCGTTNTKPASCNVVSSCNVDNGGHTSGGSGSSSSASSGSTGSSSSSSTCYETWQCTTWSECIDGNQLRTCNDSSSCGTSTLKPETSRKCEKLPSMVESNDESGFLSGITGAVIGVLGKEGGVLVLGLIALIFLLAIIIAFVRYQSANVAVDAQTGNKIDKKKVNGNGNGKK